MLCDWSSSLQEESERCRTVQLDSHPHHTWAHLSSALQESLHHLQIILDNGQLQQRSPITVQDVDV